MTDQATGGPSSPPAGLMLKTVTDLAAASSGSASARARAASRPAFQPTRMFWPMLTKSPAKGTTSTGRSAVPPPGGGALVRPGGPG